MKSFYLTLLHLPAILAAPLESRADYRLFSSHPVPREWKKAGSPEGDHVINLRIGLKQSSFAELERHLYEVSDPDHSRYGDHLSMEDIAALVAPSKHSHDAVHQWLAGHSISQEEIEYSPAKDWVMLSLPLSKVESLLDTKYHRYVSIEGKEVLRTPEYSLPMSLHGHIDTIQPTNYFGNWKKFSADFLRIPGAKAIPIAEFGRPDATLPSTTLPVPSTSVATPTATAPAAPGVPNSCSTGSEVSTLQCYRDFYNTSSYTPQVPSKNGVGTTNYLGQVPSTSDFTEFMAANRPGSSPTYGFSPIIIANATNDQTTPGVEADLDIEMVGGFTYPTNLTTWSTGGSPPYVPDKSTVNNTNEPYLTWVNYVLTQQNLPSVITTSYGDDEQSVPMDYATRVCSELAQLGARGITLLFASGDFGVGTAGNCYSNTGKHARTFLPAFPASCPYITAVGGVRDYSPEQVAFDTSNGFVSGSGFSNYFPRPSYQNVVVPQYLKAIGMLNHGLFNTSGRGYPDVAAQSYRFALTYMGAVEPVDGTSVASPVMAGILTLVNDALLAQAKKPLGFLNPLLYKTNGKGFNDIITGRSTGCNTTGFPARKGWDVASGWGTPNFPVFAKSLGVGV